MHPTDSSDLECISCPSCGGGGGGPFGPAGSAWDDENYVCPRCKGLGMIALEGAETAAERPRPGIVKAVPEVATPATKKRKASA